MDNKSKIFFIVFFIIIIVAMVILYHQIFIEKNYQILVQINCNPSKDNCFIQECDPTSKECTGNPDEDTFYYKKIIISASQFLLCDLNSESCPYISCGQGKKECEIIYCTEETKNEDEICSAPEIYNSEHPSYNKNKLRKKI